MLMCVCVRGPTEGSILLFPLQVQGKASARLRTCSAAQVKHSLSDVGMKPASVVRSFVLAFVTTTLAYDYGLSWSPCGLHTV